MISPGNQWSYGPLLITSRAHLAPDFQASLPSLRFLRFSGGDPMDVNLNFRGWLSIKNMLGNRESKYSTNITYVHDILMNWESYIYTCFHLLSNNSLVTAPLWISKKNMEETTIKTPSLQLFHASKMHLLCRTHRWLWDRFIRTQVPNEVDLQGKFVNNSLWICGTSSQIIRWIGLPFFPMNPMILAERIFLYKGVTHTIHVYSIFTCMNGWFLW